MAAPVLQLEGVVAAVTTGNLTVTIPAGEQANDILVATLVAWVPNSTTGANTVAAPSGWIKFTPDVTTITGGLIDAEYSFFWKRAVGADADPVFVRPTGWDTGTDTVWAGRCYVIRSCIQSGDPWDAITNTAISTAANPAFPALTVSGNERLGMVFAVKSDNTTMPTAATGYTVKTEASTNTGTDAGFNSYTISTNTSVSAVTPTGGVAPAQGGSVYFGVAFKPVVARTAGGIGYSAISAQPYFVDSAFTSTSTTRLVGQTFVANGKVLDSARVFVRENGTAGTTVLRAEIYALSGTLDGGTPTGSALATSSNVTASLAGGVNYTTFPFTGANRITLTDGVNYALVVRLISGANGWLLFINNQISLIAGGYLQSSNNGSSWSNAGTATDLIYGVYGADAVGAKSNTRTATGSGLGTGTATGNRVALTFNRTATGSGTGSQTSVDLHIVFRTATGSGTSSESADDQLVHDKTATGSGTGTSSSTENIIPGVRTYERTATGSATGVGLADVDLVHIRDATGTGAGTAVVIATHIHDRSATGLGTSSQLVHIALGLFRTGSGTALGTTEDSVTFIVVPVRTATGSGTSNSVIFSRITLSGLKWSYWGTNALIETP